MKFAITDDISCFGKKLKMIKNIFQSETKKVLLENFLSLSFLQVANYIFPLITLPYLVRVLGPEKYGLIAFAQAFIGYFMILTDYGFHLSAPREISINRDDKQKLSEIFSSVMIIKFFLLICSLTIMSLIIFLFEKFRRDWFLYYLTFGMVLGQVLFPQWFFQGVEKMKFITFLNLIAKMIFTISIFIFVRKQVDYYLVSLFNSLGFITAGVLSLWIVFNNFGINFFVPSKSEIFRQINEGWHIFISTVAISLYTTSNTFILGIFTNNTIVGYYAAGERIVRALQGLWTPIPQVLYPYFSKISSEHLPKAVVTFKKVLKATFIITLLISFIGCLCAPLLVPLILGGQFDKAITVVQILIFIFFAIGVNNILGIQGLIAFGYSKDFRNIVSTFGFLHILYIIPLIKNFGLIGVAVAVVATEMFIGVTEYVILVRKKLL